MSDMEISVADVGAQRDALHLIDVREDQEVALCAIDGAEHISMMQLFTGLQKTAAAQEDAIVVYCHTGVRSFEATMFLRNQGFANVRSMAGGIDAWAREVDTSMARY